MKEYSLIYQIECSILAKNQEDAEQRAEELAESIKCFKRIHKWEPEEIEISVEAVNDYE